MGRLCYCSLEEHSAGKQKPDQRRSTHLITSIAGHGHTVVADTTFNPSFFPKHSMALGLCSWTNYIKKNEVACMRDALFATNQRDVQQGLWNINFAIMIDVWFLNSRTNRFPVILERPCSSFVVGYKGFSPSPEGVVLLISGAYTKFI